MRRQSAGDIGMMSRRCAFELADATARNFFEPPVVFSERAIDIRMTGRRGGLEFSETRLRSLCEMLSMIVQRSSTSA
jgi:hypothetical protein